MMPLSFKLRFQLQFSLNMAPITFDNLKGKTITQIKKIKLDHGGEKIKVGDLFTITGKDPAFIRIQACSKRIICIGYGMSNGRIEVQGDVGDFVGQQLKDGHIIVNGNASSWVGNKMTGGRIDINGNAGDYIGAGQPGDEFGMTGGMIKICGDVEDRLGDRMRRGLIIVQGRAGDYCGSRIHAGTIIVLDKAGKYIGNGMRRGTLILAKRPAHIPATFRSCGNLKMQFLRLLFTQLTQLGDDFAVFHKYGVEAHRFAGDLARNGKGEILVLQNIDSPKR